MLLNIKTIPVQDQRVTTLGDWWENADGSFEIRLTDMGNWRYEFLVLIHELTEWSICQHLGIATKDCDDFDFLFEAEIKRGEQSPEDEAGFDHRCPYGKGHVWGDRMEKLFCFLLGVKWKAYAAACADFIAQYEPH